MRRICLGAALVAMAGSWAVDAQTTFGTLVGPITQGGVNYLIGGASDLVFDESRSRLYLVNPGQRRVEVYSTTQRRFLSAVQTDLFPISVALSRSNRFLYVTCHEGSSLNVLDLSVDPPAVVRKISLPAKPEGIAVGADERALITTIGTGPNNAAETLLIFDPSPDAGSNPIQNVVFTPPPPPSPLLPPPQGVPAFAPRTNLVASRDGTRIIGFNATNATQRALFVYDTSAGVVLRSRIVNESSSVLSVSTDGSRFMAGLRLFDAETLQVLAQQNAANLPYQLPAGSNFNLQQNQGGSVFSPNGEILYAGFNVAQAQNPRASTSHLLFNDPDNLLTTAAFYLPADLAGNMVISGDGATIFALSPSGFLILPVAQVRSSPIAVPSAMAVLLTSDYCASQPAARTQRIEVQNAGRGNLTATVQLIPPTVAVQPPPAQSAPTVQNIPGQGVPTIQFGFNTANRNSLGTVVPHSYSIVSPQAINVPPQVRVFQNMRDGDSRSDLAVVPRSVADNEGLTDMVLDSARQRIYIANSGMNRVEVYDLRQKTFLTPIKVGQLPRSLALTPDGYTLYVANSGGESISIVDPDRMVVVGRVKFPALPFNSGTGIITPSVIAATQRGLQIVMSNGTLWKLLGDEAIPRPLSPIIGSLTVAAPRTIAAAPNGEFALLLAGNGTVYLFDSLADEYVQGRALAAGQLQGYYGPVSVGPRGQYFVVNGLVLSQSLTVISAPGGAGQTRPIAAVAASGTTTYARFVIPARANAAAPVTELPTVEIADIETGITRGLPVTVLEGPQSALVGTARAIVDGRTMVVDPTATFAYVLTTSGLSVVPLGSAPVSGRPTVNRGGVVNLASYQPALSPNALASIFGSNLGRQESASTSTLPTTLGGVCVTLNNNPIPLFFTSPSQINAQIPPELAAGRFNLVVRSFENKASSVATQVALTKYSPAVLVDAGGQAAVFHAGSYKPVTLREKASRDDRLVIFAVGLGPVKEQRLVAGVPTAPSPLTETDLVKVFIDDPRIKESEMDVEWSGLVPGFVGLYQVNIYVPWYRRRGDALPVTIRIGGVDSPVTGPVVPRIPVE